MKLVFQVLVIITIIGCFVGAYIATDSDFFTHLNWHRDSTLIGKNHKHENSRIEHKHVITHTQKVFFKGDLHEHIVRHSH